MREPTLRCGRELLFALFEENESLVTGDCLSDITVEFTSIQTNRQTGPLRESIPHRHFSRVKPSILSIDRQAIGSLTAQIHPYGI